MRSSAAEAAAALRSACGDLWVRVRDRVRVRARVTVGVRVGDGVRP